MNESEGTVSGLLARARAGDRQLLDRLFAASRSYVAVLAQAQAGSRLAAKFDSSDLVQQTLLEAYRGFDSFRGRTTAEWLAWLRQILAHNAADYARRYHHTDKRAIGREVPLAVGPNSGLPLAEPAGNSESPSQILLARERELLVADALARLPADHREVILLRNLQGLPFDQVAAWMGRSRPAAQMLWMRAIRGLQEIMHQALASDVQQPQRP